MIASITTDYSSLALWRSCPQKFAYQTLSGLRKGKDSPAIEFGKLIHLAIELMNTRELPPSEPNALVEIDYLIDRKGVPSSGSGFIEVLNILAGTAALKLTSDPTQRYSVAHLLKLANAYYNIQYPNLTLRATHTERHHVMYLGQTRSGVAVYYSGTLDGLQVGSQIKVLERKSSSYLDDYPVMVKFSSQATGYVALAQDLLERDDISEIEFDVISTTGYGAAPGSKYGVPSRWLLNTNPAKLFLNCTTTRTKEQIEEWKAGVLYDCERIVQDIIRGQFSKALRPEVCHSFRASCPYADLCTAPSSVRGTLIANTMEESIWQSFQINSPLPPKQKLVV